MKNKFDENPSNDTYVFNKVNGIPIKPTSGLIEDYWFGIKFNTEVAIKSMSRLLQGTSSRQVKKLKTVKNFSWIIINLYFVLNVDLKLIFIIIPPRNPISAIFTEIFVTISKFVATVKKI
jgi:hypothetical protein